MKVESAETIRLEALKQCDVMEEVCYTYLEAIKRIRACLKALV